MSKKRVHEIAKQHGLTSKEVLAALNAAGIEATAAASSVEEDEATKALAGAGSAAAGDGKAPKAAGGDGAKAAPRRTARSESGQGTAGPAKSGKRRRRVV